ncbi:hypothetical protein GCM10010329_36190 [Streptomyces spiroverticillatus]|uniref:HNH nuclease domain-containing protein n=1 Tax=Streptomyces finlayi TaxID=67296 RepID=A0A918WZ37_9ACTN|nr:HNH endonuclease signature motif containing protein [Streptomyces finlayi]GHA10263.1 hypothetical protein GCM10010329_36190 [Streptomyces spiroverticillatus]GHC95716.1 hypothetical protein GCM10010334_35420 [Streptomyces finlayi]
MNSAHKYPRDLLQRMAAEATSMVDLLRRLNATLGSGPLRYVRGRLELYGIDTSHFVHEPLPTRPHRSYSKELLAEAAAHSTSIRGIFEYLGYPPDDSPYSLVKKRLDRHGIDTSHFQTGGYSRPISEAELTEAVAASLSMAQVLKHLDLRDVGASRARVRRSIETYGLSTDHFTGQGHYRGVPSPYRKTAEEILRPPGESPNRTRTKFLRRALEEIGVLQECAGCGVGSEWRGKRLVLEIDHINGDRLDNRRENLRYLCPNCHSQTKTYSNRSHCSAPSADPVE